VKERTLIIAAFALLPILALLTIGLRELPFGAVPQLPATLVRLLVPYAIGIVLIRLFRDRPPFILPAWLTLALLPASIGLFEIVQVPAPVVWFDLIASPLLILGGLAWSPSGKIGALFVTLGALSFPLYAVHVPAIKLAHSMLHIPWPSAFALAIICAVPFLLPRKTAVPQLEGTSGRVGTV
jgi:peptidoglycan/LPS O-acetylase OafA/YrhL